MRIRKFTPGIGFLDSRYVNTTGDTLTGTLNVQHLIPVTDSTYNLGSTTLAWANLYVDTISSITGNALALTPISGQSLTVNLATTGDFIVNTDDLVVDTSAGKVGIGTISPNQQLEITENFRLPATTATVGIFYSDGDIYIHRYGSNNFFAGRLAGNLTLTGSSNTGIGYDALKALTTGSFNTTIGAEAGQAITIGQKNVALGRMALYTNITGSNNMAIGQEALYYNTASSNTAVGDRALYNNSSGSFNVAIGENALRDNTTGAKNIALGRLALAGNLTNSENVAIGESALGGANAADYNVAIGPSALSTNTTGNKNMAIGRMAMQINTTGSENVAIGENALNRNVSARWNVAIGPSALQNNTNERNVAIGRIAMQNNTSGSENVGIGETALQANTTGVKNVGIGGNAGAANTTGSGLTFIGYYAGKTSTDALTKAGAIGYNAQVTASSSLILGGTGADQVNVGIGVTAPTARLHLLAGTATASTAPIKLTSGVSLTTAEAGAIEFTTDSLYFTITTGPTRKTIAFLESPSFTTPTLGVATCTTLSVAGNQVVGARVIDARCDDVVNSGDATTDGVIDALRDAMITHGLIAAA